MKVSDLELGGVYVAAGEPVPDGDALREDYWTYVRVVKVDESEVAVQVASAPPTGVRRGVFATGRITRSRVFVIDPGLILGTEDGYREESCRVSERIDGRCTETENRLEQAFSMLGVPAGYAAQSRWFGAPEVVHGWESECRGEPTTLIAVTEDQAPHVLAALREVTRQRIRAEHMRDAADT